MSSSPEERFNAIQDGLAKIDDQEVVHDHLLKRSRRAKVGGAVAVVATAAVAEALTRIGPSGDELSFVRDYIYGVAGATAVLESIMGFAQSQERLEEAGSVGDETLQMAIDLGIDAPSWAHRARRKRDEILTKTNSSPRPNSVE